MRTITVSALVAAALLTVVGTAPALGQTRPPDRPPVPDPTPPNPPPPNPTPDPTPPDPTPPNPTPPNPTPDPTPPNPTPPDPAPSEPQPRSSSQPGSTPSAAQAWPAVVLGATQPIARRFGPLADPFSLPGAPGATDLAGYTGLSAGEGAGGWSVWGAGSVSILENTFFADRWDGTSVTGAFGLDRKVAERVTVGLSVSGARTDLDTPYNGGDAVTDGLTVLPYVAVSITDWLSADLSAGWAWYETRTTRVFAGTTIRGTQPSNGYVVAGNVVASRWVGTMLVSTTAGFVASRDDRAQFAESDGTVVAASASDLVQARIGGTIGWYVEPVLASIGVTYVNDVVRERTIVPGAALQPANDRDAFVLEGALTVYGAGAAEGLTASLKASTELGREDLPSSTFGFDLRFAF